MPEERLTLAIAKLMLAPVSKAFNVDQDETGKQGKHCFQTSNHRVFWC